VGPRAGLDVLEKKKSSYPYRDSNSDCPEPSLVLRNCKYLAKFEVITAVLLRIEVFMDVTLCQRERERCFI
jgi:hypothetical protein